MIDAFWNTDRRQLVQNSAQPSERAGTVVGGGTVPLQLLAVLPAFNGGGAERVLLNLVSRLSGRGRATRLLVFAGVGPLSDMVPRTIATHSLETGSLRRSVLPMVKAIRALKPRIVFSTFGYVNLALLALRPFLPRGTQIWVREANLPSISLPNNRYHFLMRLGYLLAYQRADRVICSSVRMRDELVQDFGVDRTRIRILPNPVDEDAIRRLANSVIRSAGKGVRFAAAGRLVRQKGFDRLLEMFAKLGVDDAQLSIVGDGPMLVGLQHLASTLGIAERVSFEGFTDNPWCHMAGADAFLLPSRWEGMPNAALEALACGVPVIATPESGGIAEIAAETPPGAVTVVEAGQSFVEAMRRVVPGNGGHLRPSLLPPRFRMESVVDTFDQWLDERA